MKETKIFSSHISSDYPENFDMKSFYNSLRQKATSSIWFEVSEAVNNDNHKLVFIAAESIASLQSNNMNELQYRSGEKTETIETDELNFWGKTAEWQKKNTPENISHQYNGLLGFSSYDSIQLIENISLKKYAEERESSQLPLFKFSLYRYIYVFNTTLSQVVCINNYYNGENDEITEMKEQLKYTLNTGLKGFSVSNTEEKDCTEEEFLEKVNKAKHHCQIGNVFQLVVSRRFSRNYAGDPWTFFVKLKNNNAQYYFFLDEENYTIAGASPETHFSSSDDLAIVKPIAGTYKKTMHEEKDALLEKELLADPKENAEHNMLIDLARNDLSRYANDVQISKLKTIEHYNNVIHMVSQVQGKLNTELNTIRLVKEFLPAGTLSGAPKYKAVQLIDDIESSGRSYYGGLLGWIGFNNDINTCILIRSALFENGVMAYRAGAGVVISSDPQKELEEVNNKITLILNTLKEFTSYTL
ncbi:anthranilate/para-aminobenzoate synthase component I [Chryseobacterium sp. StRB126]|uniref:anthranilate synthase component I family protein n=1 Tax=Chryseobacterium sp. StRB126 TaxID=878220 RepID=UPI0004E98F0C|nr:anthranilate synthase component I family protein [Chryseobacterium sp. StRB126]BAP30976.1 anthranilate/para-aminobenzoate synthase component I [Chryseobacterium sp. StRB126]